MERNFNIYNRNMLFSNVTLRMALDYKYIMSNTGEFNFKSISKHTAVVTEFLTNFKTNKLQLIPEAKNRNADLRYQMVDFWYKFPMISEYNKDYQLGPPIDFTYYSFLVKHVRPEYINVNRIFRIVTCGAWFILFVGTLLINLKLVKLPQLKTTLGKKKIGDFTLKHLGFLGIAVMFLVSIIKANVLSYHVYQSSPQIYTLDDLMKEQNLNVLVKQESFIFRYFKKHYKTFFDNNLSPNATKKQKYIRLNNGVSFKARKNTAFVTWFYTMRRHCNHYDHLDGVNPGESFMVRPYSYLIPNNASLEGREIFVQRLQAYLETGHDRRTEDLRFEKICVVNDSKKHGTIKKLTSDLKSLAPAFAVLIVSYILSVIGILSKRGVSDMKQTIWVKNPHTHK